MVGSVAAILISSTHGVDIGEHRRASSDALTSSGSLERRCPTIARARHHFPVYQAPSLGYYHPAPVPWVATASNGLMPIPHPNHYLFPSPFGYGLNGNSHFLQYGVSNLRPLGPPLFDHAQQPMYQSIPQVNGTIKDHTKVPVPQKGVQNENSEKAPKSNTGFSLFHFGGPVAHSNGSIDVDATLSSKGLGDTIDGGAHACAKDVVEAEQYNLFSANNGIRFSF
ncbi:hypothetical protein Tco_1044374 [Tanacetum coccineum]|uniref:Uncharacterized protein n=1 Tax=Tanacetum coccineum TaxID=301880 RepID=A0ABQ5GQ95_9ASTR